LKAKITIPAKNWRAEDYASGILQGDRVMLGKAITLVESSRPEHRQLAQQVLEKCLPHSGNSLRLGITGAPGVGKSSFIESLGAWLVGNHGRKLAVLAIDPSSQLSGGSILGDKTRMEQLTALPQVFIRPSPAGKSLGGVNNATQETILLCEAAGFDTVFVETVGVGQSEFAVAEMVDFLLLLLLPGAGDELQGIKRGIVEMADLLVINKADGERVGLAKLAKKDYAQALHFFPAKESQWIPKVLTCSALEGTGLEEIWGVVEEFERRAKASGWFGENRKRQLNHWFERQLQVQLQNLFFEQESVKENLERLRQSVLDAELSPSAAAGQLLSIFLQQFGGK
jgi:LAO/AO transport system kinase